MRAKQCETNGFERRERKVSDRALQVRELRQRFDDFMTEHVVPNEATFAAQLKASSDR